MRADRLVALLVMLQQHQRVTAAQVAEELEVSERTARRDLDALGMAGLPVYSERGRAGGWRLLGGGRTDLSGLSAPEARALFLVAGPASEATPELKAALRKLVRALPETFRAGAESAASAVVLDPQGWGQRRGPYRPTHLDALAEATADGLEVELGYADRSGVVTMRTVGPLGLVHKGTNWYLVAQTDVGLRTFRVSRARSVRPTGGKVVRPEDFDLEHAWQAISQRVDEMRLTVSVTAWADVAVITPLRWIFGGQVELGDEEVDGRRPITVRGPRAELIAAQLAGFGGRVEVTGPPEARSYLARTGGELVATYGRVGEPVGGPPG